MPTECNWDSFEFGTAERTIIWPAPLWQASKWLDQSLHDGLTS
jgi:hypothetical protein